MNGQPELYNILYLLKIPFDYYEHPATPTIEDAMKYWADIDATHCKNLFFRNHKGNRHYLVVLDHRYELDIHDLEMRLKQGKLSFASERRMEKYLDIKPGSVSPLSLINDHDNHVYVFFDENLKQSAKISFHPNINTASIVMQFQDLLKFMLYTNNKFEFLKLYD